MRCPLSFLEEIVWNWGYFSLTVWWGSQCSHLGQGFFVRRSLTTGSVVLWL